MRPSGRRESGGLCAGKRLCSGGRLASLSRPPRSEGRAVSWERPVSPRKPRGRLSSEGLRLLLGPVLKAARVDIPAPVPVPAAQAVFVGDTAPVTPSRPGVKAKLQGRGPTWRQTRLAEQGPGCLSSPGVGGPAGTGLGVPAGALLSSCRHSWGARYYRVLVPNMLKCTICCCVHFF